MIDLPEKPTLAEIQSYVLQMKKERGFNTTDCFYECCLLAEECGELISAVLKTMRISDAEELNYKRGIIRSIARRLVNRDHILVVNSDIGQIEEDDWLVDVHPNYVLSCTVCFK